MNIGVYMVGSAFKCPVIIIRYLRLMMIFSHTFLQDSRCRIDTQFLFSTKDISLGRHPPHKLPFS